MINYAAEFFGTFLLVLSILASGGSPLVIGATLGLIVLIIGGLSGAHVNPAVSIAMFIKGTLTNQEVAGYVASQIAGAASSLYIFKTLAL